MPYRYFYDREMRRATRKFAELSKEMFAGLAARENTAHNDITRTMLARIELLLWPPWRATCEKDQPLDAEQPAARMRRSRDFDMGATFGVRFTMRRTTRFGTGRLSVPAARAGCSATPMVVG